MKKIILILALALSSVAYAANTNSIRTNTGDVVELGESEHSLFAKLGRAQPRFFVLRMANGYSCAATSYVYRMDLQEYTVTLCRDRIVHIEWRNV